jgi:hypothetical protein
MTSENVTSCFPDESPVLVWYPSHDADERDRRTWAWLPGSIVTYCGADEWCVVVEAAELAEPDPSVPNGDAPENLLYPLCFRDSSELRAVSADEWNRVWEGRAE